ncbi:MAG: septum formation initiator family protein [Candidatus Margulisiibacteriota bacterium]
MNRIGIAILILLVFYFIFLIRQDIIDNLDLQKEVWRSEIKIKEEANSAQRLQGRLSQLKSNEYIEMLARTKLGLVKKGEKAYKVIF